jgi:membrane fusion protein (multidrug efflux system)
MNAPAAPAPASAPGTASAAIPTHAPAGPAASPGTARVAAPAAPAAPAAAAGQRKVMTVAVLAGLVCLSLAAWRWWPWRGSESTDDAFIEGHVVAVSPTVAGRVVQVLVADNQHVAAGELLAELDPAPAQVEVDEAQAALAQAAAAADVAREQAALVDASVADADAEAVAGLASAQAALAEDRSAADAAASTAGGSADDLHRLQTMPAGVATRQQLDRAVHQADSDAAEAESAKRKVAVDEAAIATAQAKVAAAAAGTHQRAAATAGLARAQADVAHAQAELRAAQLALAWCRITAPTAGRVTRRAVEPGQYALAGQNLLAIVGDDLWVVANLKESQLRDLAPGQPAELRIDAYPQATFAAHVESIQAGSGARFSLLPAENATGNYVKVIQRVPVKLVFDALPDPARYHLGPGMSVEPVIQLVPQPEAAAAPAAASAPAPAAPGTVANQN